VFKLEKPQLKKTRLSWRPAALFVASVPVNFDLGSAGYAVQLSSPATGSNFYVQTGSVTVEFAPLRRFLAGLFFPCRVSARNYF
jgi:hypothetical protein